MKTSTTFALTAILFALTAILAVACMELFYGVNRKTPHIGIKINGHVAYFTDWNEGSQAVKDIQMSNERAFFEGQRTAISGDVRIVNTNSNWEWTKSPWDDGTKTTAGQAVERWSYAAPSN